MPLTNDIEADCLGFAKEYYDAQQAVKMTREEYIFMRYIEESKHPDSISDAVKVTLEKVLN